MPKNLPKDPALSFPGVPGNRVANEPAKRPGRARRWIKRGLLGLLAILIIAGLVGYLGRWEYAYIPGPSKALNEDRPISGLAFDIGAAKSPTPRPIA